MHFIPLRTRRFTVQLKELSIGQSIALAGFNEKTEQAALTEFLRMATSTVKGIDDPAKWTITERVFTLCHYLSSMLPDRDILLYLNFCTELPVCLLSGPCAFFSA